MTRIDRLLRSFVKVPNGCWLWQGSKTTAGYGRIGKKNRVLAHRFSYEHFLGPIPGGLNLLHKCDRPACVNPDHLYPGTNAENMRDRNRRQRQACGQRAGSAKLSPAQVKEIRARYRKGERGAGYIALGHLFNVSSMAIKKIVLGDSWKSVNADELIA